MSLFLISECGITCYCYEICLEFHMAAVCQLFMNLILHNIPVKSTLAHFPHVNVSIFLLCAFIINICNIYIESCLYRAILVSWCNDEYLVCVQ